MADTARLIRAALWGLRCIYRDGYRCKKCGVLLLDLVPAAGVQWSLFLAPDDPDTMALMAAVDDLNRRYARDRVRFASAGIGRPWKLCSEQLSPAYTARWTELLTVSP